LPVAKSLLGLLGKAAQGSDYAYVNARVRVRRSRLLARDSYAKLLKMDIPEITRFIEGTSYSKEVTELAAKFSGIDLLESALNVNEEREYAEIRKFSRGEVGTLVQRYLDRWMHWNIKTILRGRSWGAKPEEMLKELLIEDRADFTFYNNLIHAEGDGLGGVIEAVGSNVLGLDAYRVLKKAQSELQNPDLALQAYEDALDRDYYERLLGSVDTSNDEDKLFLQFIRKEVEARNLSTLVRFKAREGASDPTPFLIQAGLELKTDELRRLADATSLADLVERLKEFKIYNELKEPLEAAAQGEGLSQLQIALTRSVGDFVQRFSYRNPLSVLPIINFLMRKHLEVRNIRAIARGKQAGLTEAEIERLLVVI
jgi:V/A-type H+/Na+-transporting ATPase subunit C